MTRFYRDPFTCWLEASGTPLEVYQPAAFLGAPQLGWRIRVGRSAFVYRVPEERPDALIIVLFEREDGRAGLRSPFVDFVRFLSLVKRSGAPISFIEGHVNAMSDRPGDSLTSERIDAFYKRYLKAWDEPHPREMTWVAGDLRTFVPPLRAERREGE